MLTPGNVSDVTVAPELLTGLEGARYVLADKGYDADALRRTLRRARGRPGDPGPHHPQEKASPLTAGATATRT